MRPIAIDGGSFRHHVMGVPRHRGVIDALGPNLDCLVVGSAAWASAPLADEVERARDVYKLRRGPAVAIGPAKDDALGEAWTHTAEKLERLSSAVRIWCGQFCNEGFLRRGGRHEGRWDAVRAL